MEFDSDWITFIIASLAVFILVCIAVILRKTCSKYFCSGCDKHQNDEELGKWSRGPVPSLNKQLEIGRNIFFDHLPCCWYPCLLTPWIGVLLDESDCLLLVWGAYTKHILFLKVYFIILVHYSLKPLIKFIQYLSAAFEQNHFGNY